MLTLMLTWFAATDGEHITQLTARASDRALCRRVFFNQQVVETGAAAPAMDSSALWIFEKPSPEWGGGDLRAGAVYRIKSVTTGLYIGESPVTALNVYPVILTY